MIEETMFPHYTWGYIGLDLDNIDDIIVPSLYVRVYHIEIRRLKDKEGSLIIRKGILRGREARSPCDLFPHYTWGYIGQPPTDFLSPWVPSLYVRAYLCFYFSRMTADEEPARDITQKTRKKLCAPDFFSILSIAKNKDEKIRRKKMSKKRRVIGLTPIFRLKANDSAPFEQLQPDS